MHALCNDNQTMKTVVSSPDAPTAVGPYSQAIRAGTLLFIAGQIPLDPSGQMVEGGVDIQARRVLDNIGAILKSAGLSFSDVVRTTVYLADMNDLSGHEPRLRHVLFGALPRPLDRASRATAARCAD